jgi:2-methylcitrate dehydratase PrpD
VRVKDVMPEEILKSDSVRDLAEKVKVARNDRLVGKKVSVPVEIRVERHNGETLSEEVQHRKGDAEYPITMDECRDKFLLCWQDAGLEQDSGEEVIRYVEKMEELADVSDLADAMIS